MFPSWRALLYSLLMLAGSLYADRYQWVQEWTKVSYPRPWNTQHVLALFPFEWLNGRLNLSYEYYLKPQGSLFINVLLQGKSLAPAWSRQEQRFAIDLELGGSFIVQINSWANGLRTDLSFITGLHKSNEEQFSLGLLSRLGYQFQQDNFFIFPFFQIQASAVLTGQNIAREQLFATQWLFLPAIPLLNHTASEVLAENLSYLVALTIGLRLGIAL